MGQYTYINQDTGVTVVLLRPVEQRNEPVTLTFERSPVPDPLGAVGVARRQPTAAEGVLAGYRQAEQEPGGLKSDYTAAQIKKVWAES